MAKQVVGLFDNTSEAHQAVQDLNNAGFTADDISIVASNASGEYTTDGGTEAAEGAGAGATGGAVVGGLAGLVVGLGALAIPGVGPVIAAGTLATTLGTTALGAGIGAAAGGLVGGLVGAGIPEDDANVYAEGIRRGGTLVTVQAADDAQADRAADILDSYNVVDIDDRAADYRSSGWTRFDDTSEPYASGASGSNYDSSNRSDVDAPQSEWEESSKIGTAGGGVAGAATGAAIGSVGGPVGTVIGGIAGAVTGAGVGAAGDAAGEAAKDAATGEDDASYGENRTSTVGGQALGSVTDTNRTTDTASYQNTSASSRNLSTDEGDVAIPVVEENIRVGKREVESGGVRVTTSVEETPVNEQVNLRDETVTVDRRSVDQPVDSSTLGDAFREGTFEVRERDEEAVVSKEARVVEEVVVGKTTEDRTETVSDTVRRTNVDVEQLGGDTTRAVSSNYTTTGTNTGGTAGNTATGDAPQSEWEESSKVGTAGGAVAGAATGAAMGSVGGPVGTVIGGVAGAVTGAGVGAAGDAAGEAADDAATGEDDRYATRTMSTDTASYGRSSDSGDAPQSEWEESSKVGTAGGGVAGAATGAAIGSVGGPVGTVIGGIAGAVTGAGVGAAGDAAGEAAKDAATGEDDASTSYGSASTTPLNSSSTRYDDVSHVPSDEGVVEDTAGDIGSGTERLTGLDLDNSGSVGDRDRRDNY